MNFNQCILHPKEEFKFICLQNHKCQKKLCALCFYEHQPLNYQTIDVFLQKSSETFSNLKENKNLDSQFKEIKRRFAEAEILCHSLYQTILKKIDHVFYDLKNQNSNYITIQQKLKEKNIELFSDTEIHILTQEGLIDQIADLNIFKQTSVDKILKNVQELVNQLKEFNTSAFSKIWQKDQLFETQLLCEIDGKKKKSGQISLIGDKVFGMMHGECYYKLENKEIIQKKGGMYFLNQKVGGWNEFNQSGLISGLYWNGKKVGKWIQSYNGLSFECQYNNIGQKEGKSQDILVKRENMVIIFQSGHYSSGVKINEWELFYLNQINSLLKIGGGKYDAQGQKIGYWIDANDSYFSNESQVIWQGEYKEGRRVGEWEIRFRENSQTDFIKIGGGKYDAQGQKIGQWIVINESQFSTERQVIWQGEYKKVLRVGEWEIKFRENSQYEFLKIGGGKYDAQGQKTGQWIDINESKFSINQKIIFNGEYKAGIKIGEWKANYREEGWKSPKYTQIGGGRYNAQGQKIGQWMDINENKFSQWNKVIWQGEYKADLKVREWQILVYDDGLIDFTKHIQQIGGGKYDQQGQKIGQWMEINENKFSQWNKVILQGEYKAGIKVGKWKISYRIESSSDFKQIGGGIFGSQGQKIGQWIDINKSQFSTSKQVIWLGEYNEGLKVGEWQICFREDSQLDFIKIGGGKYDALSQKIGYWIDINDSYFSTTTQVIWQGVYKKGQRVEEWKISYRIDSKSDFKQIGGGSFGSQGQKIGQWIDINKSQFSTSKQVIWLGEYNEGLKVREWQICFREDSQSDFIKIGGGKYDALSQKIGQWIDINDSYFSTTTQVIWQGVYKEGRRVGEWEIRFRENSQSGFIQIGGGKYDEQGQKIGYWIDINDSYFSTQSQVIWKGKYKEGRRVGKWQIYYRIDSKSIFWNIGGGEFNIQGQKIGFWDDIFESIFSNTNSNVWPGKYEAGQKVGAWDRIMNAQAFF